MSTLEPERLLALLQAFIEAPTWAESRRIVEDAPDLLSDEADALLGRLLVQNEDNPRAVRVLELRRELLRRCRAEGVEATFADKHDVSSEIASILEELDRKGRTTDIPRRVELCRQALHELDRAQNPVLWAMLQQDLANSLAQSPTAVREENLDWAIHHYNQALEIYTYQDFPVDWAMTQNNLANAYTQRIRAERAENLERAIHHYNQALEVNTRQAFPADWAATHYNLANAYADRIRGDRANNLEHAVDHYHQALEALISQADPARWAATHYNLASAYTQRIHGDRAENLERAISHYNQALEIYTYQDLPTNWVQTLNNLARVYTQRIRGERADNLERAIHLLCQVLEVYTHQAFPIDWASTHDNLGRAYANRIRGDLADNFERAIHHYSQALEVYTCQADSERWAAIQNSLAIAYRDRIRGERAENLERAIHHYNQALEVRTRQAFPADWATTQTNLGNAYADRTRGGRADNLERAIHHYGQALEIHTRQADPEHWAAAQNNLANIYSNRIRGDQAENLEQAISHYNQALDVRTREAFPTDWAQTLNNLASAYSRRIRGDRAENLECAISHYNQALEVYTRQAFPADWAQTVANLAIAYRDRIRGDRVENLERANFCFQSALELYTPQAWPERARDVSRELGSSRFAAGDWLSAHTSFAQAQELTDEFYAATLLREVREQEAGANAAMYAEDAFCLAQLGDLPGAWTILETGRARALRQGIDQAGARRALATAPQAVRRRHKELDSRERALRQALQSSEDDPYHRPYHELRDELAAITGELRDLENELLTAVGFQIGLPSLQEVQALPLLQDGRTGLLSLAVTEHGTLVLLLTAHELRQVIVSDLTEADAQALIQGPEEDPGWGSWLDIYRQARRVRWQGTIAETLNTLGQRLWPTLDGMLQDAGCRRLVLVPQGLLLLLPLHACPLDGGERLCDRYTVAYTPAGSILPQLLQEETLAGTPQAVIVANPTGDLRHTPSEALVMGQTFDAAVTLWEQDATQARLIDAARDADVLHVSGHGVYDWNEPEGSGLILATGGQEAAGRGQEADRFTVAEMRDQLRLSHARLVTLSACETGLVEFRRGLADEYLGLPGILLQAGARAVVASLWAVDDLATALLMRQFYLEWQAGTVCIATALQRAQAWLRTRSRAQVEEALDELDEAWEPWRQQDADPAMKRRAVEQYWEILAARRSLREMPDPPFAHPYWWAAFQAVGDVL